MIETHPILRATLGAHTGPQAIWRVGKQAIGRIAAPRATPPCAC
jgi:hypothetical protein